MAARYRRMARNAPDHWDSGHHTRTDGAAARAGAAHGAGSRDGCREGIAREHDSPHGGVRADATYTDRQVARRPCGLWNGPVDPDLSCPQPWAERNQDRADAGIPCREMG